MWVPVTREHGQQSLGGCWGSKFRQARPWHWWRCLAKVSGLQEWVYESRGRGITCKKVCCWRYPRSFERKGLLNLADVFKHVQAVWFGMPLNKLQLHLTMIMQLASWGSTEIFLLCYPTSHPNPNAFCNPQIQPTVSVPQLVPPVGPRPEQRGGALRRHGDTRAAALRGDPHGGSCCGAASAATQIWWERLSFAWWGARWWFWISWKICVSSYRKNAWHCRDCDCPVRKSCLKECVLRWFTYWFIFIGSY